MMSRQNPHPSNGRLNCYNPPSLDRRLLGISRTGAWVKTEDRPGNAETVNRTGTCEPITRRVDGRQWKLPPTALSVSVYRWTTVKARLVPGENPTPALARSTTAQISSICNRESYITVRL